ncbi:hypothetical protein GCM10028791_16000 [Echinicola sediminis]
MIQNMSLPKIQASGYKGLYAQRQVFTFTLMALVSVVTWGHVAVIGNKNKNAMVSQSGRGLLGRY